MRGIIGCITGGEFELDEGEWSIGRDRAPPRVPVGPPLSDGPPPVTDPPPEPPSAPLMFLVSWAVALPLAVVAASDTGVRTPAPPLTLISAMPHDWRLRICTGPTTLGTPTLPFGLPAIAGQGNSGRKKSLERREWNEDSGTDEGQDTAWWGICYGISIERNALFLMVWYIFDWTRPIRSLDWWRFLRVVNNTRTRSSGQAAASHEFCESW